ncbi:MAG: hydrolase [Alphaproteobacteria bacterium]
MPPRPSDEPPRAWQRMLSGRRLDLLNPSPLDVEIDDISHGLARVARWNGQTTGEHPFSVAQHSVVVLDLALALRPGLDTEGQLIALLHDAPEYVIGDLISPFKAAVGNGYKAVELRLQHAIHIRYGLVPDPPRTTLSLIKRADRICAFYEAVQLAGFEEHEATRIFGAPRGCPKPVLTPLAPKEAQKLFLLRFNTIYAALESVRGWRTPSGEAKCHSYSNQSMSSEHKDL